eukprot:evm.model.scf_7.18 EVM.evm.TU.scf_7.18   scf_7:141849-143027(-)
MEPKRPARKSQLQAYIAVLRALSSVKLDWSQQKLMVDLRKQLKISLEQHMKSLDKVLKDPEGGATPSSAWRRCTCNRGEAREVSLPPAPWPASCPAARQCTTRGPQVSQKWYCSNVPWVPKLP